MGECPMMRNGPKTTASTKNAEKVTDEEGGERRCTMVRVLRGNGDYTRTEGLQAHCSETLCEGEGVGGRALEPCNGHRAVRVVGGYAGGNAASVVDPAFRGAKQRGRRLGHHGHRSCTMMQKRGDRWIRQTRTDRERQKKSKRAAENEQTGRRQTHSKPHMQTATTS